MSATMPAANAYLTRALDGVQLIEASAGTGKTYTLATLFTRLIVEQRLRMGQVLAVTYTEAATQELRKRIRERLSLAAGLVGTLAGNDDSHEAALTRGILQRQLERGEETPDQLSRRLRIAAEETDLAAIFTIHGFCARVLREHALETGQGFDAFELLGNARDLYAEVAADLWRMHAADPADADALMGLWNGPDALAGDLPALCGPLPLYPQVPSDTDPRAQAETQAVRAARAANLIEAIANHQADARAAIAAAFDNKVFDGRRARRPSFDKAFEELQAGTRLGDWPRTDKTHVQKLLPDALAGFCKEGQGAGAPASPLFDALRDWCEADTAWQRVQLLQRTALLHHLRAEARQRLDALKRLRRVRTYDDLIEGVAEALEGPHRQALVARLRAQYRVALVDEFQDTDERQWRIFARVFGDSDEVRAIGDVPALFLIGDPKQAIYGFRGGDVATYLLARGEADEAPRLDHNFRSRPGVLRAVQALYDGAREAGQDAFLHPGIQFEPVHAGGKRGDADYLRDGEPAPALTLRLLRQADGQPLGADGSRDAATAACVAEIHRVLNDAREGRALLDGRPVRPGDIAVLVRNHRDATRMQQALARAGVPAVAAGKQSLFETTEAGELRTLLLALLQPADSGRLRAALSTVLLGEDAHAIAALETEGDAQRHYQARLLHWRERWQRSGPFALVSDLCAEQAERLLGLIDGERRMTNYLQLGEQLQEAAAHTLGLHGLLDWLQARIANADPDDETQLLRLESDALRVQIVTLHKSKGLEYPLVYLPFTGIGTRRPDSAATACCTKAAAACCAGASTRRIRRGRPPATRLPAMARPRTHACSMSASPAPSMRCGSRRATSPTSPGVASRRCWPAPNRCAGTPMSASSKARPNRRRRACPPNTTPAWRPRASPAAVSPPTGGSTASPSSPTPNPAPTRLPPPPRLTPAARTKPAWPTSTNPAPKPPLPSSPPIRVSPAATSAWSCTPRWKTPTSLPGATGDPATMRPPDRTESSPTPCARVAMPKPMSPTASPCWCR